MELLPLTSQNGRLAVNKDTFPFLCRDEPGSLFSLVPSIYAELIMTPEKLALIFSHNSWRQSKLAYFQNGELFLQKEKVQ